MIMQARAKKPDEFYVQALLLAEVVKRILEMKAEKRLSQKPSMELKNVIEFRKRMRVSGLEKFQEKTYISSINFYKTEKDMQNEKILGALIIYVPEEYIIKLLEDLEYPYVDESDEEALEDACGTICNMIAGSFKSGLTQLGFREPVMSHFSSYQNNVVKGVPIYLNRMQVYEIGFEIGGQVRIITDLNMGPIPKIYPELSD